jgi:hypothetical protein
MNSESVDLANRLLESSILMVNAVRRLIVVMTEQTAAVAAENKPVGDKPPQKERSRLPATTGDGFFRDGETLVRIRTKDGVAKRQSCPFEIAPLLIRRMYEKNAIKRNVVTSVLLMDENVGNDAGSVVTNWLKEIGVIRRMGGGYRLRNHNPESPEGALRVEFEKLPVLSYVGEKE